MCDLINKYQQSGLVPLDPTKHFEQCDVCFKKFHPFDLNEIEGFSPSGDYRYLLVCDGCKGIEK